MRFEAEQRDLRQNDDPQGRFPTRPVRPAFGSTMPNPMNAPGARTESTEISTFMAGSRGRRMHDRSGLAGGDARREEGRCALHDFDAEIALRVKRRSHRATFRKIIALILRRRKYWAIRNRGRIDRSCTRSSFSRTSILKLVADRLSQADRAWVSRSGASRCRRSSQ